MSLPVTITKKKERVRKNGREGGREKGRKEMLPERRERGDKRLSSS